MHLRDDTCAEACNAAACSVYVILGYSISVRLHHGRGPKMQSEGVLGVYLFRTCRDYSPEAEAGLDFF